jgi:drug/metabolite transporter (DMT)-like permease
MTYATPPFQNAGEIAALAAAFCWVVGPMAFEFAGKRIGSLSVNMTRLVLAFSFLTIYAAVTRGMPLPIDASAHNWIWLSVSGIIGFTIGDLLLFQAFVVIGSRLAMLLMAYVPPFTAIIGFFLMSERLSAMDIMGMILTVAGVAIVILEKPNGNGKAEPNQIPIKGIFLGLGGAAGQAAGLALSKYGMQAYDAFSATQIRTIAGMVGFLVIYTMLGFWTKYAQTLKDKKAFGLVTLGAFFGPFLGVSFSLLAVKFTQSGIAASLMALVPVFIIPPAIIIKKEKITLRTLLGSLVAVAGSVLFFV